MKKLKRRLSAALRGGSEQPPPAQLQGAYRTWSLSDSMSQLADRLAADGVIVEECDPAARGHHYDDARYRSRNGHSGGGGHGNGHHQPRPHSIYHTRPYSSYYGSHASVVQEQRALGSDGESVEVSPCTSDQLPSTGGSQPRYLVNVKMRHKPTRKWSEEEIQKRLSLPADLRLPVAVIEKLNRIPALDQPLTRKNRRASLSEIGFGKLETYEKLDKLGEGTYATVYRGRSLLSNQYVALKEIRLEQEEGAPCTAIREVSLLRSLRHANVVTLHDIIHTDRLLTLVFEYVDQDLKAYMDSVGGVLHMNNVRLFTFQLLRGLAYCHQRRVLHRDLKPQNLLITRNGELKLADFGLARAKSVPTKTYSNEVVTLWYRPPDVLLGSTDYSTHIDMWGVGCILYEMISGRALFPGATADEQLLLIFKLLGSPNPLRHPTVCESKAYQQYAHQRYPADGMVRGVPRFEAEPAAYDLMMRFLQYEGRDRMSAAEALRHPFFRVLPSAVFSIADDESIMNVKGVRLASDPLSHSQQQPRSGLFKKGDRRSMMVGMDRL